MVNPSLDRLDGCPRMLIPNFIGGICEVAWPASWSEVAGTLVAHAFVDKKQKGKKQFGSGSETAVARRFGGGALHLSDGGSFGGTELPGQSKSKEAGLLIEGLMRLGGASQDLSAARKPFRTGQSSSLSIKYKGEESAADSIESVALSFGAQTSLSAYEVPGAIATGSPSLRIRHENQTR